MPMSRNSHIAARQEIATPSNYSINGSVAFTQEGARARADLNWNGEFSNPESVSSGQNAVVLRSELARFFVAVSQFITYVDANPTGGSYLPSRAFSKVTFGSVDSDSYDCWDVGANEYVVPKDGQYVVATKLRLLDAESAGSVPPGVSYGQGAGTSIGDNPEFSWFVSAPNRNGSFNWRVLTANAGDRLKMFAYLDHDSSTNVAAAMTIYRL